MANKKVLGASGLSKYDELIKAYIKRMGCPGHVYNSSKQSLAEGADLNGSTSNEAEGTLSHAEGSYTRVEGDYGHAEGERSEIRGDYVRASHVEGGATRVYSPRSHAEGWHTECSFRPYSTFDHDDESGEYDHTFEGYYRIGVQHAEGYASKALAPACHAEGNSTIALGPASHAEGCNSFALGFASHAEGGTNVGATEYGNFKIRSFEDDVWKSAISGEIPSGFSSNRREWFFIENEDLEDALDVPHVFIFDYNSQEAKDSNLDRITKEDIIAHISPGSTKYIDGDYIINPGKDDEYEVYLCGTLFHADYGAKRLWSRAPYGEQWDSYYYFIRTSGYDSDHFNEPMCNSAIGSYSHAEGYGTRAEGFASHTGGYGTIANTQQVTSIGRYNDKTANGDLFVIGNGNNAKTGRKTVFRVKDNASYITGGNDCIVEVTGRVNATGGCYNTSDIRKKENIQEISADKAIEMLKNCKPIVYNLKDDPDKTKQIGLVAQEVQQYFPEVVCSDDQGYLSIDYSKLSVILFAVLQKMILNKN